MRPRVRLCCGPFSETGLLEFLGALPHRAGAQRPVHHGSSFICAGPNLYVFGVGEGGGGGRSLASVYWQLLVEHSVLAPLHTQQS